MRFSKTRLSLVTVAAASLLLGACGGRSSDGSGGADGGGSAMLQNKGSDTLVNVAQAWAETYADVKPGVVIAVSGGGSGTGISALLNGTVDIANASRKLKQKEIDAARARGIEPVEFIVGFDALAVYAHKDNPIEGITVAQLKAIYAEGGASDSWSDLGVTVPGAKDGTIVRVSRQNNSGTYAYFKSAVIGKGASTSSARSTCTAAKTSSTWSRRRREPSDTAVSPTRPTT